MGLAKSMKKMGLEAMSEFKNMNVLSVFAKDDEAQKDIEMIKASGGNENSVTPINNEGETNTLNPSG